MRTRPMSEAVRQRVRTAAARLGTQDPLPFVGPLIDASFNLPEGDGRYGDNALSPGAVPLEPSFSEAEPRTLRFTMEPLGPQASPTVRRNEATSYMRGLVGQLFGRGALHWFDRTSEPWRGMGRMSGQGFGAWFGSGFDSDGLYSSKVYYELEDGQLDVLPTELARIVRDATDALPTLAPLFTTITCGRRHGRQRATLYQRGPLRSDDLRILLERLGLSHQLPGLMRVMGLALGGRFDLPEGTVLIGLSNTPDGPEFKLEVLLGMLDDLPPSFVELLKLGLVERPRHLSALGQWLNAFTPDESDLPGDFSVLSIRVTPKQSAHVSLYLRPMGFEVPMPAEAAVPPPTAA
ncbi:hypothetical protein [Ferruginivarius sediminum]|uniref:Uncharacterized protein n=1 Tax=Ferruginivarius sediminum TaxID=2661937 RepID=A0A369T6Q1_9PROT|nr:hypothetical protein [Ferruginivarius sediminum]RDD61003.1 hypothetical protein DRB17_14855 [Ferruginivarius sediminum]